MWEHDIKPTDKALRQTDTLNNFEIDPKEFRAMTDGIDSLDIEEEDKNSGADGLLQPHIDQGGGEVKPKQKEDDFLEDFVILQRPKLDKYNKMEKLQKEEK
jgi:hypothetical protein